MEEMDASLVAMAILTSVNARQIFGWHSVTIDGISKKLCSVSFCFNQSAFDDEFFLTREEDELMR
jgi:hypothetical protein